jgi:hypothetical protein
MIASCRSPIGICQCAASLLVALTIGASAAAADECGPDKLGTSRVISVGTHGGLEVGLKTYPRTVPLADHEVILTFDDGPDARTTPKILDALAGQCVRATFFEIGRNAESLPLIARRWTATRSRITPIPIPSPPCASCRRPSPEPTSSRA